MESSASHYDGTHATPVRCTRPLLIGKLSLSDGELRGVSEVGREAVFRQRGLKEQQRYSVTTHQRRRRGSVTTRSRSFTSDTCEG